MLVGAMPRSSYATRTVSVPPGGRLFVYSDGAFEVRKRDGTDLDFDREFVSALLAKGRSPRVTEEMLDWARSLHGGGPALADDFSMMAVDFPVPENPPAP
jgi:serine phosphatase RsbU (regulator of sigma subunit)